MTISEIAKLAGVSTSTVSKIINNKAQSIHPETRKRVLEIVKEYHYTPYGMVKSVSQAKTFQLAVLLRYSGKANQLVCGIVRGAQAHGYSVLLFDSQNDLQLELKHISSLCQQNIDGVLWEPVSAQSAEHAHYFTERGIYISYLNSSLDFDSYEIDFLQMGYALTQKLIDFKHSKIACLMKPDNHRSRLVLEGYRKCLYDHQIPYDPNLELFANEPDYCLKIITSGITGIVSSHFASALSFYEQIDRLHYSIPADFSLVSLKNDIRGAASFPYISGIEIPYEEFGYFVCRQLIQKCEKKEISEGTTFSPPCCFNAEQSIDVPSSFRSKKIVVIGSINIDNTFNVNSLPQSGKTTRILNSTVTLGGKGANQAIGAARLGGKVSLIGEIGSDIDSTFVLNTLSNENLPTQGIFRDIESPTGKAYIYIEQNGESTISIFSGANAYLTCDRILQRCHLFKNAGYCLISSEIPFETVLEAAKLSHNCGAKNIVNPVTLNRITGELTPYIDILIPNRETAASLCSPNLSVEEQAEYFFGLGIPTVIITLGHQGCYLKTASVSRFFPAINVTAVDTTGGADAFISALAVYLTRGFSLETAIQIATCAASFCVTRQCVVPALVDKITLEAYIGRTYPELLEEPV